MKFLNMDNISTCQNHARSNSQILVSSFAFQGKLFSVFFETIVGPDFTILRTSLMKFVGFLLLQSHSMQFQCIPCDFHWE